MIRRLIRWVLSGIRLRRLTAADRMAIEWSRTSDVVLRRMERDRKRLLALKRKMELVGDAVMEDLEEGEATLRQHNHAMEALQDRIDVMEKHTIPELVESHQLILQRLRAETALQVQRRVSATPVQEDELL